jgi:DNA-binding transcriptional ArsR family regulator
MTTTDGYDKQAELFQALSHPIRLRIMDILARQESCVCHLTALLGKRQPYVSQQLAILREAGLVSDRREGTLIYYRPADEHLAAILDEGRTVVLELSAEKLDFPSIPEGAVAGCPCPRCQK